MTLVRRLTTEQREKLLALPLVGVLTVAAEPGRAPLATPIWHDYRPGGLVVVLTSPRLRKARLIAEAGRFALCVRETEWPNRHVSVEGPVVETRPVTDADRLAMARRYLPPEIAAAYVEATHEEQGGNVSISMRPQRWNTADFTDLAERLNLSPASL
ncbi:pyridoxamine 5'-phosphate oxidase family protein [Actinophytocola oryzae]|uniref:Pyridoxamine 5'-phosphate oxidase n=1 Tax=Actinophytocola oryzae TaxID=502181 RepID=A0A4R7VY88_9PSEU|nr:pyridoxamine 5'-phosphate oxidase family protein [Actinophytocola oryzae]TDV55136.1 pyridoxamine 5'-phosphate oxidase [Actinophytocola oryzae]